MDGSGTVFTTQKTNLGSVMAYASTTKKLFVIDDTNGQLKVYTDGGAAPTISVLYT
jgi:hypothetical protein